MNNPEEIDTALYQVRRAETELTMQLGRMVLAKQVRAILKDVMRNQGQSGARELTPEEKAIMALLDDISFQTLKALEKVTDAKANPVLAQLTPRLQL